MFDAQLRQYAQQIKSTGLYRQRQIINDANGLNFSSNDYLALMNDICIKKAYEDGFNRYPTGSGGSMLVSGYHPMHKALEDEFSKALCVEQCLLFSSGYAANLSVMGLLSRLGAHALIDKGVHASIYDGLKLSDCAHSRFLHNNLGDLSANINKASLPNRVLVTESIFSMSGQMAPLSQMAKLARLKSLPMIVDEAHAFGVKGTQGLGLIVENQLSQTDVPLRIIPLGKAFASSGAIVAGQSLWVDALLQGARPYIYSTAISPAVAYGLLKTFDVVRDANARRAHLNKLVDYFRKRIQGSPLSWRDSSSAIQQLQLGCPHKALKYGQSLEKKGIRCIPMRTPTVSLQETGLRVILNYNHQPEHIERLLQFLEQI